MGGGRGQSWGGGGEISETHLHLSLTGDQFFLKKKLQYWVSQLLDLTRAKKYLTCSLSHQEITQGRTSPFPHTDLLVAVSAPARRRRLPALVPLGHAEVPHLRAQLPHLGHRHGVLAQAGRQGRILN